MIELTIGILLIPLSVFFGVTFANIHRERSRELAWKTDKTYLGGKNKYNSLNVEEEVTIYMKSTHKD